MSLPQGAYVRCCDLSSAKNDEQTKPGFLPILLLYLAFQSSLMILSHLRSLWDSVSITLSPSSNPETLFQKSLALGYNTNSLSGVTSFNKGHFQTPRRMHGCRDLVCSQLCNIHIEDGPSHLPVMSQSSYTKYLHGSLNSLFSHFLFLLRSANVPQCGSFLTLASGCDELQEAISENRHDRL